MNSHAMFTELLDKLDTKTSEAAVAQKTVERLSRDLRALQALIPNLIQVARLTAENHPADSDLGSLARAVLKEAGAS